MLNVAPKGSLWEMLNVELRIIQSEGPYRSQGVLSQGILPQRDALGMDWHWGNTSTPKNPRLPKRAHNSGQ